MHDHSTDGGRVAFENAVSAHQLRLHLDNAHDYMTAGWAYDALVDQHHKCHAAEDARSAEREDAPPTVFRAVFRAVTGDRSIYLEDANGTLYLAEPVDPRHLPTVGPLYRLTERAPVDILAATKASLAATSAWLDAHPSDKAVMGR